MNSAKNGANIECACGTRVLAWGAPNVVVRQCDCPTCIDANNGPIMGGIMEGQPVDELLDGATEFNISVNSNGLEQLSSMPSMNCAGAAPNSPAELFCGTAEFELERAL